MHRIQTCYTGVAPGVKALHGEKLARCETINLTVIVYAQLRLGAERMCTKCVSIQDAVNFKLIGAGAVLGAGRAFSTLIS